MADDKITTAPKQEEISIFHSGINSTDPQKRIEAIQKLAKHPRAEIAEVLASKCATEHEADPNVRIAAIEALGGMEEFVNLNPIRVALIGDSAKEVRISAAHALASIGTEECIPYLVTALDDPEKEVSIAATVALGELGNKDTISSLADFANKHGGDELLFNAARHAIERISDRQLQSIEGTVPTKVSQNQTQEKKRLQKT